MLIVESPDLFCEATHLLLCCPVQDSIGGNAKTVIIANISPSEVCVQETLSTLGFAARARKIVNKVCVVCWCV